MADKPQQNYANHRRFVPGFHYFTFTVLLVNLVWAFWKLGRGLFSDAYPVNFDLVLGALMACAFIAIALYARLFPLSVQDRVIRMEMRERLAQILPEDLKGRIRELSRGQLVGLRFAGDSEVAELMRETLEKNLTNEEIKKKVKIWRPDNFRC